jgi:hypothetical protein
MYYPYFRGKQFELIAIRESAELLAGAGFTPIIEPVKETLNGLHRALTAIADAKGTAIVIVNPLHGDHSEDGDGISTLLKDSFLGTDGISAGILLRDDMDTDEAMAEYEKHLAHRPTFIHSGFTEAKALAEKIGQELSKTRHVFNEANCGKLYRKHFQGSERVLLRDGFRRRKNADHPPVEEFSDLHATYSEEGVSGFGDFLIVGDDFTEGGGPAYAVAIHLTFIDPDKDEVMYVYHFVSTTKDTPTDPAGKFGQAVAKLVEKLNTGDSKLFESSAIKEFRELHAKGHYPGLGSVKKLSMKHHIETLVDYFS